MENKINTEQLTKGNAYRFISIRPGGNDTTLILGVINDPLRRKQINDDIMRMYPSEQVGFADLNLDTCELMMAGGEFCGNATRSTAYLALRGEPGEISIKVSGVAKKLKAGVTPEGEAFAQMPIYPEVDRITSDPDNPKNSIVYMEGIAQYVNWDSISVEGKEPEEIKRQAFELIKQKGLDAYPAAGIMYVRKTEKGLEIVPVVYVRDIDTLFYETACGSGTTAVGLVLAVQKGNSIKNIPIYQPSGLPIKVSVGYDGKKFKKAMIKGPVELLGSGTLVESEKGSYVIEQVNSTNQLVTALDKLDLVAAYDVFKKAPYFEEFTEREVKDIFTGYQQKGILFLARTSEKIIGFGAAIPLSQEKIIATLAEACGIDPKEAWYMADLGVVEDRRREKIGTQLIQARLNVLPKDSTAIMRTSVNNIASQTIYRNLGFTQMDGMVQEVEQKRVDGSVWRDERIFFAKVM